MFLIVSATPIALAARQTEVLIGNAKDWKELFLVSSSAALSNKTFMFFNNLGDAEVTMKLIDKAAKVTVYESGSDAVVKNYAKYLELNGKGAATVTYDGYTDLQTKLFSGTFQGYILLEPTFGVEAATAFPIIRLKGYAPLFLTKENIEQVKQVTKGNPNILLAGRFPVRTSQPFKGEKFTGTYEDNAVSLVKMAYDANTANVWGIISKIDKIDMETIKEGLPMLVYYGEMDSLYRSLNATPRLVDFEVISGEMADVARGLEKSAGRDFKLILKFAQTYTNYPGKVGQLYDISTVSFDYPIQDLRIEKVRYYPELGSVALTFKNYGNVEEMFFSAVEFSGNAILDNNIHPLEPGESKTIPYRLESDGGDTVRTVVNTRYGILPPFRRAIESEDGGAVLVRDAEQIGLQYVNYTIGLLGADYEDSRGVLTLRVENPNSESLVMFGELIIDSNRVLGSPVKRIGANGQGLLVIETPYLTAADFVNDSYPVIIYYGKDDTLLSQEFNVRLVKHINNISGFLTGAGSTAIIIPLVIIALVIIFLVISGKKRKNRF
jgi:hypothetical protein